MKIAITDVETTGLDPSFHEMIELGLVVFDSKEFEISDTFESKIQIEFPERMDEKAQKVNGYSKEEWLAAPSLEEVMKIYQEKTKDCFFCAHNVVFDYSFIQAGFKKVGLKDFFGRHKIDLLTLAWSKISHEEISGWGLRSVCNYLEIPPEPDVHRAINGAMTEYKVYKRLMQYK